MPFATGSAGESSPTGQADGMPHLPAARMTGLVSGTANRRAWNLVRPWRLLTGRGVVAGAESVMPV